MGYPPPGGNFRNGPNQGRGGGMAPPFQGQGRQMNQFPNSPHQAARSPALTNSIPGTPNMGQAMPMPNQQYNYYQPHMQGPQVNAPSTFNHQADSFKFNKNGRGRKWPNNEKFSNGHRSKEHSNQLFSYTYTANEQLPFVHEGFGHNDMKIGSMPSERLGPGHLPHFDQVNEPMSATPLEHQHSSADQADLPPLPPAIPPPIFPPLIPYPKMDTTNIMKMDISPEGGGFEQFLTMSQQQNFPGYPPQFDNRMGGGMPMQQAPYMYPQMAQMGYMTGPPQSPQPNFQQPNAYIPGQYGAQAQPMSRNSSQMSEQRPASSMGGQPGTPSITPSVSSSHTPQPKAAPAASPAFTRPTRKSAAIQIKRPDGEALDLESFKAPVSPAPRDRTRTPPVIASTPTPPPKSSTPLHNRTDSSAISGKNPEQVRLEMMEKVKKAAESEKATDSQAKADEAAKLAAEAKSKEEEKAKEEAKAAEEAKAKEELEAKAAEEKRKKEEEEELERQIREIEEAEAEEEKRQEEITKKRAAEKKAADEAAAEKRKANAAEEDRKLREAEREMERLEDEKERKRAEAAEARAGDKSETDSEKKETKEDDKNAPTTPSTLASKLSNLTLGTDSGTSTPASDDSMGPPPKVPSTEKRGKPAALNLAPLNTKPVEPPQPSAALQSLKSARFLTVLNSSIYPPNISSPNPALNSAVTTKGKSFKYDKEFLLQFQKVFTEKPSMEFESQIKALIGEGDGGSARSASTRTSSGMGPRQGSNRNPPGAFAMGSFGAVGGGKTLPPGTTSAERFAMASGAMPRPAINPMASFNRPGGAFPGGSSMTRTPSSSTMNSMPHSPRQQSRSQRGGGSKRDGYQASNAKQEAQAAKTMPLTAGMDLKPIQVSEKGWKPRSIGQSQSATGAAGPTPGASGAGHMDPDMVQRKVKAALNKMTPEKFDKIADQILAIAAQSKDEADGRTLRQVIQLTFEKATDEAHWASMYARFCKRMLETMSPDIKDESILDKNGNIVSGGNLFRKYLLNRCQEEFERGWKMDLPDKPEGERGEEKTEEAVMLSDEYYIAAAAKRRGLGLVQFIGELYKLSMLTERIMHECVKKLVDYTGIPDEAEIESLTKLLKTIGSNLDGTEKGKPMMDVYFQRIQTMIDTPELPSRLRFMLMDIVDLRKAHWQSKETNKGPKTLDEVRAEVGSNVRRLHHIANISQAEAAAAQKAAENARGNQRGGGGGGRMQMGRGDSRNFSNQYGNQPPVDYQKNTVGMDDLRRLTNKGAANRASSQQMSFGPTSMFSSRSNSGRKMGPGGSLSRTGEDSGASSRTGTPPQQKEKESATSANAFRYV
jgi:translation initiation factor 4G